MKKHFLITVLSIFIFIGVGKSQNVSISDSIENVNPMDVFKMWQNNDTIRLEWATVGHTYFTETIELIKIGNSYKTNLLGKYLNSIDELIAEKVLNHEQLEVLKKELESLIVKEKEYKNSNWRNNWTEQDYYLTLSINNKIFWEYQKLKDDRKNSFKEIKKTVFGIQEPKPRKKKKRKY